MHFSAANDATWNDPRTQPGVIDRMSVAQRCEKFVIFPVFGGK